MEMGFVCPANTAFAMVRKASANKVDGYAHLPASQLPDKKKRSAHCRH